MASALTLWASANPWVLAKYRRPELGGRWGQTREGQNSRRQVPLGKKKNPTKHREILRLGICLSFGCGWGEEQKGIVTANEHSQGSEEGIHTTGIA